MGNTLATIPGATSSPSKVQKAQMIDSELKGAGFDSGQIDNMVAQANDVIGCDANCRKQRRIDELQAAVNEAQDDVDNGPSNLAKAKKELITFRDGIAGYTNSMRTQYATQAQVLERNHRAAHESNMEETRTLIAELSTGETYLNNAKELLKVKLKKHEDLTRNIDRDTGIVRTNNRRGEYQADSIDTYTTVNTVLKIIYYILFAVYVFIVLIRRGGYKSKMQWAIALFFGLFPVLLIHPLFSLFSFLMSSFGGWLTSQAPKNVEYNL